MKNPRTSPNYRATGGQPPFRNGISNLQLCHGLWSIPQLSSINSVLAGLIFQAQCWVAGGEAPAEQHAGLMNGRQSAELHLYPEGVCYSPMASLSPRITPHTLGRRGDSTPQALLFKVHITHTCLLHSVCLDLFAWSSLDLTQPLMGLCCILKKMKRLQLPNLSSALVVSLGSCLM